MAKVPTPVSVPGTEVQPDLAAVTQPVNDAGQEAAEAQRNDDQADADAKLNADQEALEAADDTASVPARILVDHLSFRSGQFALLTEAQAADCEGWADLDPAAVEYAQAEAAE